MTKSAEPAAERTESLDFSERWLRDGLSAIDPPGGFLAVEVDMSNARSQRNALRHAGTAVTYTHLIVVAVAAALTKHPELHQVVAGNLRLRPKSVDLCLSIGGENAMTPVLIIADAGRKSAGEVAEEIKLRSAQARAEDEKRFRLLRRWGWLVPFAFLRRSLVRFLLNRLWYRRRASGTFQVSVVPGVDLVAPFLFNTVAALGAGRVREKVVVVDGQIEIRPVITIVCCANHKVWNGIDGAKFLSAVKSELERCELQKEKE
jgi:pyruvate dehydrogenase E2 component (dihydrolipoamide acetyltransferase)